MNHIAEALSPARVVEVLPGTLKIEGSGIQIKKMVSKFASRTLASEGLLEHRAPNASRLSPTR